jgi:hypothetical protein
MMEWWSGGVGALGGSEIFLIILFLRFRLNEDANERNALWPVPSHLLRSFYTEQP